MVKNLRETKSTLSLRLLPEIEEARQRVTELEAQVERLQSMQRREMESLAGSTTTRSEVKDEAKRDESPRQILESAESLPSSSQTISSHPSSHLSPWGKAKPENPWGPSWGPSWAPGHMPNVESSSTSSYFTPPVGDELRPRLPIQLRHDSLDLPRAYKTLIAEEDLPSQSSATSMSYLEADKSAEQRWPVPSHGGVYMQTEVGMGLERQPTSVVKEAQRSDTRASDFGIPKSYYSFPARKSLLNSSLGDLRLETTRPEVLQEPLEYTRASGISSRRHLPSNLFNQEEPSNPNPLPQYRTATSNTQQATDTGSSIQRKFPSSSEASDSRPFYSMSGWDEERMRPCTEPSFFEKFNQSLQNQRQVSKESLITKALAVDGNTLKAPEAYTQPFCDFLTENPTVWHAVDYFEKKLDKAGFQKLSERKLWSETLKQGGKYYVQRNGSSLIAFIVGGGYESGNGIAMIAGHIDALTARLKPVSSKKTSAGYVQLGVAPYAGALNSTWWDRDLGIGGRVLVKDSSTGKITTRLVKLGWPIARIPTLAPHFGVGMLGQNNAETQAVPIIGLDSSDIGATEEEFKNLTMGDQGTFAATQPPKLVRAIAGELSIQDYSSIVNWELELYDTQPAQIGGLEKEFIFAGRIDDKLCSWAAMEGLLASAAEPISDSDGIIKLVGVFDDEEIGSLLRQGARGNFLPSIIERISETFSKTGSSANILSQTYANSFLVSADVTHAVNPNFLSSYLENHAPRLNVGVVVCADSNGHMTTDSVSTALLTRIAENCGSKLQLFMIRNDSRSGGTVGPVLSSAMGVRAIDAGIPQLSMHSIRATTGALDPGLGVKIFKGFLDGFEKVDAEFE